MVKKTNPQVVVAQAQTAGRAVAQQPTQPDPFLPVKIAFFDWVTHTEARVTEKLEKINQILIDRIPGARQQVQYKYIPVTNETDLEVIVTATRTGLGRPVWQKRLNPAGTTNNATFHYQLEYQRPGVEGIIQLTARVPDGVPVNKTFVAREDRVQQFSVVRGTAPRTLDIVETLA